MRHLTFLAAVAAPLLAPRAEACGGFFCSQTPVLQTAERIVFEIDGDTVSAYVQLQYTGNDPSFAWVIPVPDTPSVQVGVGADMFDALDAQTAPRFTNGALAAPAASFAPMGCGVGGPGGGAGEPRISSRYIPPPDVSVWRAQQVGPYETVVLSAKRASDLNDWLNLNGYRVERSADPIVQAYLDEGMKLLALRLSQDQPSTSIEPVKLVYRDRRGCARIPIRLTAVAAAPGLEILTWVFGASRAKPLNYEEAAIDPSRLRGPDDYMAELSRAVDAKGGRAFVTEMATPTAKLSKSGDPSLDALLEKHAFVTRLRTTIDPLEMTLDPDLGRDLQRGEVSNVIEIGGSGFGLIAGFAGILLVLARRRR